MAHRVPGLASSSTRASASDAMPSFLNKVFGYKKHDEKDRPTRDGPESGTLLDGKYEAIPPIVSPSAASFADAQLGKDSDRDTGFSLFKHKSRSVVQKLSQKSSVAAPHLTLHLPLKENADSRALGVVFEADPVSQALIDEAVIAARRLSPLEALTLIRSCAQTIAERGLETLGIMHPHWFSASPEVQRKLISLFIRSLSPQSQITTLSPTSSGPSSAFENELHYTRSPRDVAAVLRWALRHLTLENGRFGKDGTEWAWYNTFFEAERNASYPPRAFSQLLLPQLPTAHVELLTVTLGLISSLASHAETNGISGSKLSKFLGIWLLLATRVEESDDWNRFYARWERAGRILEHLFLAHLREEALGLRLPTRLQELVQSYPYSKGSLTIEDGFLPRPRFSSRQYDALCIRVESLLGDGRRQPKRNPIQLLFEAFQLPIENPSADEHTALWQTLKTAVFEDVTPPSPGGPQFARIFADETMQLLSLIPDGSNATSPTLLVSPVTKTVSRKRSPSLSKVLERALSKAKANEGSTPVSPTSPTSPVITDWAQFSMSGFGDAPTTQPLAVVLNDDDIEVTQPRLSRKTSLRTKSRSRRRRSEEREPSDTLSPSQTEPEAPIIETRVASVHAVQIDEAFIDFWSDAIIDPISANWPTFVLCGLKDIPSAEQPIRWLVIEQAYSRQVAPRNPSPDGRRGRSPRPSFKSDISGFRINSMFSSARKRFSMFSKSTSDLDPKRSGGKTPVTGELGEILVEEEAAFPSTIPNKVDRRVDGNGGRTTGGIANQVNTSEICALPIVSVAMAVDVPKEASTRAVAETVSIEPTPQSGAGHDGGGVVLPPATATDGLVSVTLDADMADSRMSDSTLLAPTTEDAVAEDGPVQAEPLEQAEVGLVAPADECLPVQSLAEPSNLVQAEIANDVRGVAESVAMPPAPESNVNVVNPITPAAAVSAESPGTISQEPREDKQPSGEASAHVSTPAAEPVGQQDVDNLPPLPTTNVEPIVIVTETPAQLEQEPITCVTDGNGEVKGVAELAEILTPTSERVALVEETPGPEGYVDVHGRDGAAQGPTAHPEVVDAVPQEVNAELKPALAVEEPSVTVPVEVPSVEIVPVVDVSAQNVFVQAEHTADEVPKFAAEEEARASVLGSIVQAVEDPAAPKVFTTRESVDLGLLVEDVPRAVEVRDMGAPTPVVETAALVDDTPGPETATEENFEAPFIAQSDAIQDEAAVVQCTPHMQDPATERTPLAEEASASIEAELSTQILAESTTESLPEASTTLKTVEAQSIDLLVEDRNGQARAPASAAVDCISEVTDEARELNPVEDDAMAREAMEETVASVGDGPAVIESVVGRVSLDEVSAASVTQSADERAVDGSGEAAGEVNSAVRADESADEERVVVDVGEPEMVVDQEAKVNVLTAVMVSSEDALSVVEAAEQVDPTAAVETSDVAGVQEVDVPSVDVSEQATVPSEEVVEP